jgi:hypothetical protein
VNEVTEIAQTTIKTERIVVDFGEPPFPARVWFGFIAETRKSAPNRRRLLKAHPQASCCLRATADYG